MTIHDKIYALVIILVQSTLYNDRLILINFAERFVRFKKKYKSFISGRSFSENRMLGIEKSLYIRRVSLESYTKCVNSSRRSGILHSFCE